MYYVLKMVIFLSGIGSGNCVLKMDGLQVINVSEFENQLFGIELEIKIPP